MFSIEFGDIFKNTFFIEHLRWLLLSKVSKLRSIWRLTRVKGKNFGTWKRMSFFLTVNVSLTKWFIFDSPNESIKKQKNGSLDFLRIIIWKQQIAQSGHTTMRRLQSFLISINCNGSNCTRKRLFLFSAFQNSFQVNWDIGFMEDH